MQDEHVGICSQGAGCEAVDGKLLRGNIMGRGNSGSPDLVGFLLKLDSTRKDPEKPKVEASPKRLPTGA